MDGAILVLEKMPDNCRECPCGKDISNPVETCILCKAANGCVINNESEQRPNWCPLSPVPEKKEVMGMGRITLRDFEHRGKQMGWNACIDAIKKKQPE